ncbi:choice-of-anchor Q domain-containing protein, partial [Metasolibacillus meyeri]|uniref:choice-of-anchor Q domain-containing protein n=1 Tax=Metasolibacillus meyeri TaxID=1071052 RepID=UPI0019311273
MFNSSSNPTLTNVTFSSNSARDGGGGMYNNTSNPTLTNVTFSSNRAMDGGGMYNDYNNSLKLTNVTFSSNSATSSGGGMYNVSSSSTLTNVTMSGNTSAIYGGDSGSKIRNSIIIANHGQPAITDYSGEIESSIVDKEAENGVYVGNFYDESGTKIAGSYTAAELFIDPTTSDYRLRAKSPAIDKGNDSWNTTSTDIVGNPRKQGAAIDLGAYEALPYYVTYDKNGATGGTVPQDNKTYE